MSVNGIRVQSRFSFVYLNVDIMRYMEDEGGYDVGQTNGNHFVML